MKETIKDWVPAVIESIVGAPAVVAGVADTDAELEPFPFALIALITTS